MYNIYMVGICGVAMGTLAGMLKELGHNVNGSDSNVYPPMSTMLEKWGIEINNEFSEEKLTKLDFVIIGNAISRGNAEVEYILNNNISYMSMTEALYRFFLSKKEVIAICGTHGKTTTTSLLSHILKFSGEEPSFLVGGVTKNYNSNYYLGTGKYFIIEGDEYDSAFFEKTPKFIHYRPNHIVLTSLEFDHADIYNNLDEIKLWFKRLVNIVPSEGKIVYNKKYKIFEDIIEDSYSENVSYGGSQGDYNFEFQEYDGEFSILSITTPDEEVVKFKTKSWGDFNFENITAAVAIARKIGIPFEKIQGAVETFEGVKRRQDIIYSDENIKVLEDFAHHPTAVEEMLKMVKHRFSDSKIFAFYEPRSATSRRNIFQNELPVAFKNADHVFLKTPYGVDKIPVDERIDIKKISKEINLLGVNSIVFDSVDYMIDNFLKLIKKDEKVVCVIMSNGGFDNIYEKIKSNLELYRKNIEDGVVL